MTFVRRCCAKASVCCAIASIASIASVASCSLGALDGFAGTPAPDGGGDAASVIDGSTPSDAPSFDAPINPQDGGSCVNADTICASFDNGAPDLGWNAKNGVGSWSLVPSAQSPPNALAFTLPNTNGGVALIGPGFTKTFNGVWSNIVCTFAAAIDELPSDGVVDLLSFNSQTPTNDHVSLRVHPLQFRLTSCRNFSDCQPEVSSGSLPTLGQFHQYRVEWTKTGELRFAFDGNARTTTSTKTPLTGAQSLVDITFGLPYQPYGSAGTWRVRYDDVACTRTP
jgi:hypothetical protein